MLATENLVAPSQMMHLCSTVPLSSNPQQEGKTSGTCLVAADSPERYKEVWCWALQYFQALNIMETDSFIMDGYDQFVLLVGASAAGKTSFVVRLQIQMC